MYNFDFSGTAKMRNFLRQAMFMLVLSVSAVKKVGNKPV